MDAGAASTKPNSDAPSSIATSLPPEGVTRWRELQKLFQCSREWVRLLEKQGRFPKRHRLSPRCSVWSNKELLRWFADPSNYRSEG